ncbi:TIR domain-containing protein, partial [Rahnella bonaserana]
MRKIKIFLSYCHVDSAHKNKILNFLIPNSGEQIEIWHDRELLAGDDFSDEIKSKLEQSDIFIFLVSQDFLNSKYCLNVELDIALKKKAEEDEMRIIPVILDYCTFKKSKMSPYNALPSDARPISTYENLNQAYLEIANEISEVVSYMTQSRLVERRDISTLSSDATKEKLKLDFEKNLNDLGFTVQHSRKDTLYLHDLFIYPDLKRMKYDFDDYDVFVGAKETLEPEKIFNKNTLIIGEEQSGKSTLCKVIFQDCFAAGLMPILVKGDQFKKTSEIEQVVLSHHKEQYQGSLVSKSKIIIIIDDITESPINEKFKRTLLQNLKSLYKSLIIIADSKIKFSEQLLKDFDSFNRYEITNFGHIQRSQIVEKWNNIGTDESINLEDQQSSNDNLKRNIDSILMKNIVPSKPIFILMILQILESKSQNNFALTSYGHCYHSLIVQAINKANVKMDELNDYFNYLCELSYYIFNKGNSRITLQDLEDFKKQYSSNYYIVSHDEVLKKLIKSNILNIFN